MPFQYSSWIPTQQRNYSALHLLPGCCPAIPQIFFLPLWSSPFAAIYWLMSHCSSFLGDLSFGSLILLQCIFPDIIPGDFHIHISGPPNTLPNSTLLQLLIPIHIPDLCTSSSNSSLLSNYCLLLFQFTFSSTPTPKMITLHFSLNLFPHPHVPGLLLSCKHLGTLLALSCFTGTDLKKPQNKFNQTLPIWHLLPKAELVWKNTQPSCPLTSSRLLGIPGNMTSPSAFTLR